MDTEDAGFVGGGGDHAALMRIAADDDGFTPPFGVFALFDSGKERIHIDMEDTAVLVIGFWFLVPGFWFLVAKH